MKARFNDLTFNRQGEQVLSFTLPKGEDARLLFDELNGLDLSLEVKKYRQKRSLNANNYAWELLNKLAERLNKSSIEIYKDIIKQLGICKQAEVSENAVDTVIHSWSLHGIGWFAEKVDYAEPGLVKINLYYGSSQYNTKQMSRLIDSIVQECMQQEIDTKTPDEIARLVSLWQK